MTNAYDVYVNRKGGRYIIGVVNGYPQGWRFLPHTTAHQRSRKLHATPEKAIPRWVGEYELIARQPKRPVESPAEALDRAMATTYRDEAETCQRCGRKGTPPCACSTPDQPEPRPDTAFGQ